MKIAIIGTGYVGLPTGVGFADLGINVICVDKLQSKIDDLNQGIVTLYEERLEELLKKNLAKGRLSFTTDLSAAVNTADIIIIAVGTPPHPDTQEADMKYIYAVAHDIAPLLNKYTVIAIKSTVPVGTGDEVERIIKSVNKNADVDLVSLPEFLREGFAVEDFFNPDRIIIGVENAKAKNVISQLYTAIERKTEILYVSRKSAETIKYASNSFLAVKIHFINEIADFCEKSGAKIDEVAKGMGLDSRIGAKFLQCGPGYGGSCFPKDTMAMSHMAKKFKTKLNLVDVTIEQNNARKIKMANKILHAVRNVKNPHIATLGLTFKGGTDDVRDSPAVEIIHELLKHNVTVKAYDPKGMTNAKQILGDTVIFAKDAYDACQNADICVILTEWDEFKEIDFSKVNMKTKIIIDLRNLLINKEISTLGFEYIRIG